jgi:Zn finger protein HypA/HybF involved in hydrogenase expression
MNPASLDGNAAAGDLADIFAFDVTTAVVTCAACHHTQAVATLRAYLRVPGMVLRCPSCDAVQIRLVRGPERAWLDLRGITMLEVRLPDDV